MIGVAVWAVFEPVLARSPLEVVHQELEPIRRDGDAESVMFVARRHGP